MKYIFVLKLNVTDKKCLISNNSTIYDHLCNHCRHWHKQYTYLVTLQIIRSHVLFNFDNFDGFMISKIGKFPLIDHEMQYYRLISKA